MANTDKPKLSRRNFLRRLSTGLGIAALGTSQSSAQEPQSEHPEDVRPDAPPQPPVLESAGGWTASEVGVAVGVGAAATAAAGLYALSREDVQNLLTFRPRKNFEGKTLSELKEPDIYHGLKELNIASQTLVTAEGDNFVIWKTETLDQNKKTLILFPGNAGHLGESPEKGPGRIVLGNGTDAYINTIKEAAEKGYNVVALNYVGYAGSTQGEATQENMFAGVEQAMQALLEYGIKPKDMQLVGISMGTTMAAHAANYMADTDVFNHLSEAEQVVNLELVNGVINVPEAIRALAGRAQGALANILWRDAVMLDTGKELAELAAKVGDRGNVTFLRGENDPATPKNQIEAHRKAACGMNFRSEEIADARHYPPPADILRQFDEMEKGQFTDNGVDAAQVRARQINVQSESAAKQGLTLF